METEIINNKPVRKRIFIIPVIIVSVGIIYYSIMLMIGPVQKLEALKIEFGPKPTEKTKADERILSDSAYLNLLKEKAFLQSKVAMAKTYCQSA
jgi:hypothetical protein